MNIREVAEELRRAEETIVFWKNSSTIRQKKLLEKDKEIERLNNIIDKAIEYINKNILISFDKVGFKTDKVAGIVVDKLLEILQDGDEV